jgi:hypothetical protein
MVTLCIGVTTNLMRARNYAHAEERVTDLGKKLVAHVVIFMRDGL